MPILVAQRGHVPRTTGATGTAGEQVVVTQIAAALERMKPAGWGLRIIDADPPDWMYAGDVFMSLHCDGSDYPAAHGASVGYPDAAGGELAARWKAAYVAQGWSRGFKPDNYTKGLSGFYAYDNALARGNRVRMVAEFGHLTNAEDAAWIRANIDKCAAAVWQAVAGQIGGDTVFGIGSSGADVKNFQGMLTHLGIYQREPNGVYDSYMRDVVTAFQTAYGVPVNGNVDFWTIWRLQGVYGDATHPAPSDANEQIATLEAKLDKCVELAREILTLVS